MLSFLFRKETVILLITGGIAFAASNTGNNVQWLVFSLLCAYIILGKGASYLNNRKIEIELLELPDIFAGKKSFIPLKITKNNAYRSSYHLHISLQFSPSVKSGEVFLLKLGKSENKTLFMEAEFPHRGEYKLVGASVLSSFPFDVFKSKRKISMQKKIIVYPEIMDVDSNARLYFANNYELSVSKRGEGNEILSLYQYGGNEPLRNIHWKLSAKKDELWVKEYANEESPKVIIFLDWKRIPPDKREEAISVACSLALKYTNSAIMWRLVSGYFDSDFGSNSVHLRKCLTYLALLNDYRQSEGLPMPEITLKTHYSHLLYLSHFMN
ncbi:MAG: hypothetical protein A2Y62_10745 [Candidatus Fischerbacteria bacterium RBG_13_37_8]|uniref:Uncharacterized protein n=1 Tax=Candidatus Fischerbacteria bacterium RBG_13_37_8 TaxID=1817863 RepID=A0A1F5VUS7_9BACT|nr:MAG: hypothetical protein A2Y62_10745 [Candidatus Fischerbacteria bacterium RBG_13_37_8]